MANSVKSSNTLHIHSRDIRNYDAVGHFSLQLAELMGQIGWKVHLWAENFDEGLSSKVGHRSHFYDQLQPKDVIFLNHSIYDPDLEKIASLENKKVLYYHNITPSNLLGDDEQITRTNCKKGEEQIPLFPLFDEVVANSKFTAATIKQSFEEHGVKFDRDINNLPPLVRTNMPRVPERNQSFDMRFLYVGRFVKHKRVDQLLDVFEQISLERPGCSLTLVGGPPEGVCVDVLRLRAREVQERTGSKIQFFHHLSAEDLTRVYLESSACLHMSEHEGFCVPALDSILFDLPMFFRSQSAILEVLGLSGRTISENAFEGAVQILNFLNDKKTLDEDSKKRSDRREFWKTELNGSKIANLIEGLSRQ